jgi:hypothetical protein
MAMLEKFFPSSLPLEPHDDLQQVLSRYLFQFLTHMIAFATATGGT